MDLKKGLIGKSRPLFVLLILLYGLTLLLLLSKVLQGKWNQAALCLLSMILYILPALLGILFHAEIPPLLFGIAACFAASANLGGEVLGFYLRTPLWDSVLHFLWGILAAVIGYSMPDLLGRRTGISRFIPRSAAVLLSVSFAMLTAVVWEFSEFAIDFCFHTDMQKDTWITGISSVFLQPEALNQARSIEISDIIVNGEPWPAYLDIGLRDTMTDLLCTFIGTVPGALLILTDYRKKGRSRLLVWLMPSPLPNQTKDGDRTE